MYEHIHEYSWKHSEAKSHTQQHTDSTKRSVPGWERTYNALVSTPLSQRISTLCQPGIILWMKNNINLITMIPAQNAMNRRYYLKIYHSYSTCIVLDSKLKSCLLVYQVYILYHNLPYLYISCIFYIIIPLLVYTSCIFCIIISLTCIPVVYSLNQVLILIENCSFCVNLKIFCQYFIKFVIEIAIHEKKKV